MIADQSGYLDVLSMQNENASCSFRSPKRSSDGELSQYSEAQKTCCISTTSTATLPSFPCLLSPLRNDDTSTVYGRRPLLSSGTLSSGNSTFQPGYETIVPTVPTSPGGRTFPAVSYQDPIGVSWRQSGNGVYDELEQSSGCWPSDTSSQSPGIYPYYARPDQPLSPVGVTEMRKEKSRDAARSRRGKENHEFLSLAKLLPLPSAITSQLDKASVIRLCISSLKLRTFCQQGDPPWLKETPKKDNPGAILNGARLPLRQRPGTPTTSHPEHLFDSVHDVLETDFGSSALQAHDGFVIALGDDGQILYISETVSVYLGLSQVELTGSSIFEYVHEGDRYELACALRIPNASRILHDVDMETKYDQREQSSKSPEGALNEEDKSGYGFPLDRNSPNSSHGTSNNFGTHEKAQKAPAKLDVRRCETLVHPNSGLGLCIRFRSTLTKRGIQMKYSGYRVLAVQWRSRHRLSGAHDSDTNGDMENPVESPELQHPASEARMGSLLGYVVCATALPSLNMNEVRVDKSCFTMKLDLSFRILSADARMEELVREPAELLCGRSFYDMCFGMDVHICADLHRNVIRKGQALSSYYRVHLGAASGLYWIQTCAHLMITAKTPTDQSIVAMHYILSHTDSGSQGSSAGCISRQKHNLSGNSGNSTCGSAVFGPTLDDCLDAADGVTDDLDEFVSQSTPCALPLDPTRRSVQKQHAEEKTTKRKKKIKAPADLSTESNAKQPQSDRKALVNEESCPAPTKRSRTVICHAGLEPGADDDSLEFKEF